MVDVPSPTVLQETAPLLWLDTTAMRMGCLSLKHYPLLITHMMRKKEPISF